MSRDNEDNAREAPPRVFPRSTVCGAYQVVVALRYLRRNWLSYLAVIGVALSVGTLIVVMSVMTGFDEELRARIRGTLSHLIVQSGHREYFDGYAAKMENIEALSEVVACAPHMDGRGLVKFGRSGDEYRFANFSGIDLPQEVRTTDFAEYWRTGMRVDALPRIRRLLDRGLAATAEEVKRARKNADALLRVAVGLASKLTDKDFQALPEADRNRLRRWATRLGVDLAKARRGNVKRAGEAAAKNSAQASRYLKEALPGVRSSFDDKAYLNGFLSPRLVDLAAAIGPEGFAKLAPKQQKRLEAWATEGEVSLEKLWKDFKPSWGPKRHLRREGESPCIAGGDATVLGRNIDGTPAVCGLGAFMAIIAPVGWDERAVKSCRITGKIKSGMYEYDSHQVYIPLDVAQRMLRQSGKVSAINVKLKDYGEAETARAKILGILLPRDLLAWRKALAPALRRAPAVAALPDGEQVASVVKRVNAKLDVPEGLAANYTNWVGTGHPYGPDYARAVAADLKALTRWVESNPDLLKRVDAKRLKGFLTLAAERGKGSAGAGLRVFTWEDKKRNVLLAVMFERRILGLILFLLVLVSGFVILSILYTSVITKTRDIGILKAMGATVRGIMTVFLLNGLFIGVIGAVLGVIGGIVVCAERNRIEDILYRVFRFRVFPRDVYNLDAIPVAEDPTIMIVIIASTAVIVAFFSALYPAWRAARMDPVEAIRYE